MPLFFWIVIGAGVVLALLGEMSRSNGFQNDLTAWGVITVAVGAIGKFCVWYAP